MPQYIWITIWAIIIILLLFSIPFREKFGTYSSNYKQYCSVCDGKDSYACSRCYNCGRSTDFSGYTKCVAGDSRGPYFDNHTAYWTYSDESLYYPQTHRFPEILNKSLFPYSKTYPMKAII